MKVLKYYCNHCGREIIYSDFCKGHEYVIWPPNTDFADRKTIHLCDACKDELDEWLHHSEDLIKRY